MVDSPGISDAEWRVMQVVWDKAPIAAADVVAALADETDWNPRTIKTMLGRLVAKGALTYTEEGNRYLYRAAVTRAAAVREESKSFLQRVFAGDTSLMLSHLVKSSRLSDDDIAELRRILEQKER